MPEMGNSSHTPGPNRSNSQRPSRTVSEWLNGQSSSEQSKLTELGVTRERSRRPTGATQSGQDQRPNFWRSLFSQKPKRSPRPMPSSSTPDNAARGNDTPRSPRHREAQSVNHKPTGIETMAVMRQKQASRFGVPPRAAGLPTFLTTPTPSSNGADPSLRQTERRRSRQSPPARSRRSPGATGKPLEARSRRSAKQGGTRPHHRGIAAALYATRLLILSVGIGVLAGTVLSAWDPAHRSQAGASQQALKPSVSSTVNNEAIAAIPTLKLGQEIASLKSAVQAMALQNPQFTPGVFLLDLDTGAYTDVNGGASFAAASTIKVPILVAFLQDLDAGKISLDEMLTMHKELIATGSGEMQYQAPGTQFTALETASKMIMISDNTATNMLIARLGGLTALNQRFRSWGLMTTALNNVLPDLEGTNTTSPKDLAMLMARISQGDLMSIRSRDRMLDIMRKTVNHSQLPQGLEPGATISHKTGDIGSLIGDVGLIDVPNGKRYAIAVFIKRGFNDDRAYDLVRQLSQLTYRYFIAPPTNQTRSSTQSLPAGQPSPSADTSPPRST